MRSLVPVRALMDRRLHGNRGQVTAAPSCRAAASHIRSRAPVEGHLERLLFEENPTSQCPGFRVEEAGVSKRLAIGTSAVDPEVKRSTGGLTRP